ncbi:hypothetical protein H2200_002035 [Cladophialophora chaetospira]|uniref:Uncharacterized protein n=1 Tax=Cladophialophora chaetospira TaxID=386627 RepID=A0AA39CMN8_9EURO|nr:hypothetical protein H2200_002035 [Cladophialophora chaetospira]
MFALDHKTLLCLALFIGLFAVWAAVGTNFEDFTTLVFNGLVYLSTGIYFSMVEAFGWVWIRAIWGMERMRAG